MNQHSQTDPTERRPIGIFDSGIGGLSVWKALRELLPGEDVLYLADQQQLPYGEKPVEWVRELSIRITRFLLDQPVKAVIFACNTATAAALDHIRTQFPETPFVGMEPAVKPAAQATKTGKVGVLATAGTIGSERYASLMDRFAKGVELIENPCQGLVRLIESGKTDQPETGALLESILLPLKKAGVDTLVLGCTHYPFVAPLIREIWAEDVSLIDPAPAVARRARQVLASSGLLAKHPDRGTDRFLTTGDAEAFQQQLHHLLDLQVYATRVPPFLPDMDTIRKVILAQLRENDPDTYLDISAVARQLSGESGQDLLAPVLIVARQMERNNELEWSRAGKNSRSAGPKDTPGAFV